MENKNNNLDTFKTLHLVHGILALVFCAFPLIYVGFGVVMLSGILPTPEKDPTQEIGIVMIVVGSIISLMIAAFGILQIYASKFIGQRKNYTFIFVMAVMTCLTGMLGLILGVFSIIELNKPEVKKLFDEKSRQ